MIDYDKKKESSYIQYRNVNNLYGWEKLQKLPVNNFRLIKNSSQLRNKETILKKAMDDVFFKLMFNILKSYINFIMIDHFYLKE